MSTRSETTPQVASDAIAEWAIAGAALEWPQALDEVAGELAPDDFATYEARSVFAAARAIWTVHGTTSTGSVDDLLVVDHLMDNLPGVGIDTWRDAIISARMAAVRPRREHVDIVMRWARARSITGECHVATDSLARAENPSVVADRLVEHVGQILDRDRVSFPDVASFDDVVSASDATVTWAVPGVAYHRCRGIITAAEGSGKALDCDTPIPTPDGWTTMGEIQVGSTVFDEAGHPTPVVAATPVMTGRPCYQVTFSDGESIVADESHLWVTVSYQGRQRGRWDPKVSTTAEIARTLTARGGFVKNHLVEVCGPLDCPEQDLPIDPYTLGCWLGDGEARGARVTCHTKDVKIIDEIVKAGYTAHRTPATPYGWYISHDAAIRTAIKQGTVYMQDGHSARSAASLVGVTKDRMTLYAKVRGAPMGGRAKTSAASSVRDAPPRISTFVGQLRDLGVLENKHIPRQYLRSSSQQRLALLQGLMDTDGYVSGNGGGHKRGFGAARCELTTTLKCLADDVYELLVSLGIKATAIESPAKLNGRVVGTKWRIAFQTALPVFRLSRKLSRQTPLRTHRARVRYIVAVDPVASRPVRCIQVGAQSGCYLAGRGMVPTHNSTLLRQIAFCASQGVHPFTTRPIRPIRTLIIDAENSAAVIATTGKPLRDALRLRLGDRYDPNRCQVLRIDQAVDVRDATMRRRILSRIRAVKPELVVMGPLYKIARSRPGENYEDTADDTQRALMELLDGAERPFGLLLEHHAPKRSGVSRREFVPMGSQRWQAWPDFGFGLEESERTVQGGNTSVTYELKPWRGTRVNLAWPERFIRSAMGGKLLPSGLLWDASWENDGGVNNPLLSDRTLAPSTNGHGHLEVPYVAPPENGYLDF